MKGPLDLGHGVIVEFFVEDGKGNVIGLVENHPSATTQTGRCSGSVRFDTPEARAAYSTPGAFWQVQSWEPLTLSPSLLCRSCGHHGFIREGRWVPA